MFNNQIIAGSSGQGGEVQQSLKFNDDESQYLSWTPAAAGSLTTWTWSGWVKRGNLGNGTLFSGGSGSAITTNWIAFINDSLAFSVADGTYYLQSTSVYRDPSAFYHVVAVYDSGNSTSSNRMKLYVNGVQITSFSASTYPPQNYAGYINGANGNYFGIRASYGDLYFDGYLSNIHFIDGQALDPTSFGQFTNGYWEKKDYAGAYGTNGFHLTFQDDVVSEGFNAVTYKGTGADQSISGLGFEPDFVWIKVRNNPNNHRLFDSVRGASSDLISNSTSAESITSTRLVSFDTDGFTVGSNAEVNGNGYSHVGWAWDAGSGSPVSNTDGSITSTVKANPAYGFSIVSYTGNGSTGQSVGTGLSSSDLVIIKNRSATTSWHVLTGATTPAISGNTFSLDSGTNRLNLNLTGGYSSYGMDAQTNANGNSYIAYCFNSVANYSSIGSYTGTGAAGNAVTGLGFKPAWLMVKRTDSANSWMMLDNTRTPYGRKGHYLYAEQSSAETYYQEIDFDNDGFTLQATGGAINASGGTYIYMAFADTREAAFWKDVSGQGNHWTPNNLDYRDSLPDSPANNFATFNSIHTDNTITLSEGNLKIVHGYDSGVGTTFGFNPSDATGYYAEFYKITGTYGEIGIAPTNISDLSKPATAGKNGYVLYLSSGQKANNGSYTTYGSAVAAGDIVSVAVKDGKIWWGVNGVWIAGGDPENGTNPAFSGISGEYFFIQAYDTNAGTALQTIANFGQDSTFAGAKPMGAYTDDSELGTFQYQPPAGFKSLCSANLPIPTIIDGSDYFNTVLYTGNGTSQSITGVGFQPDWTWIKSRAGTYGAFNHTLWDVVRGAGADKELTSSQTYAEGGASTSLYGYVSALDSDGFTLTAGSTNSTQVNGSSTTYVAWNWKAGGTAVSNTDGSITSQVSANVDAGFSVLTFNGTGANATVGHGLGVAPSMVIMKQRNNSGFQWPVYHSSLGTDKFLFLQRTDGQFTSTAIWQNTAPSSSVIYLGANGNDNNNTGSNMVAYCFADVEGYSKAGSYTGNGSADGPFVYTGFRPAFIMVKMISGAQRWGMTDSARAPNNPNFNTLYAEDSIAEYSGTAHDRDYLSNGFKLRNTDTIFNGSGSTYIYLAFAENPFKYANAR